MKIEKKYISFILVLLIVLLSKTVFFTGLYEDYLKFILISISGLIFLFKGINKKNLMILITLLCLLLISFILNFNQIDFYFTISLQGMILNLLPMAIIASFITKKEFIINYVNIIYCFCIISLVCFSIVFINPSLVQLISTNIVLGKTPYIVSFFYTWGWDHVFTRNSGPFWEPGAFQGFINLAIIFIILNKSFIKNNKFKLIIFIITLLTTQSTTGYGVFLLIIIGFSRELMNFFTKSMLVKFIILIIIGVTSQYILSSDTVLLKLEEDNGSAITRTNDFNSSIIMISEKPISGYGPGEAKSEREFELDIFHNSNGLLSMIYSYGIIFSSYYLFRMFLGINSVINIDSILKNTIGLIIFIVLHSTEGLVWLPVYLIFIFQFKNDELSV